MPTIDTWCFDIEKRKTQERALKLVRMHKILLNKTRIDTRTLYRVRHTERAKKN